MSRLLFVILVSIFWFYAPSVSYAATGPVQCGSSPIDRAKEWLLGIDCRMGQYIQAGLPEHTINLNGSAALPSNTPSNNTAQNETTSVEQKYYVVGAMKTPKPVPFEIGNWFKEQLAKTGIIPNQSAKDTSASCLPPDMAVKFDKNNTAWGACQCAGLPSCGTDNQPSWK